MHSKSTNYLITLRMNPTQQFDAKSLVWALVAILLLAGLFLVARGTNVTQAEGQNTQEWTWAITHNPVSVFDQAKAVFVDEFNKDSDTKISLKIIGPDDFETTANRLSTSEIFDLMAKKQV